VIILMEIILRSEHTILLAKRNNYHFCTDEFSCFHYNIALYEYYNFVLYKVEQTQLQRRVYIFLSLSAKIFSATFINENVFFSYANAARKNEQESIKNKQHTAKSTIQSFYGVTNGCNGSCSFSNNYSRVLLRCLQEKRAFA
jgi:hypothetical protein